MVDEPMRVGHELVPLLPGEINLPGRIVVFDYRDIVTRPGDGWAVSAVLGKNDRVSRKKSSALIQCHHLLSTFKNN
jgi:hypothetical protein